VEPNIRLADSNDLDALLAMMRQLRAEDYAVGQPPPASEVLSRLVLDFLSTPSLGRIWVACDGEGVKPLHPVSVFASSISK
jgi:hypothetical protein